MATIDPTGGEAARATTGATVLRSGAWNLASRALPQVYIALISIAAARFLGPDDFGRQSFIAFASVSLILLLSAGIPQAMVRYIGDAMGRGDVAAVRGLTAWGWRIEIVAGLAGGAILVAVGLAGAEPQAAWILAGAATVGGTIASVPRAFLNGLQLWRAPSLIGMWTGAVGAVVTVAVLAAGGGIAGMFAVEVVATSMALVLLTVLARRREHELTVPPRLEHALRSEAVRYSFLAAITTVLTFIVWRRTELFFLDRFSTDAQIGFYSIAFTAATVPVLVFQGVAGVLLPSIATLHGAGHSERIRSGVSRAGRLMLAAAIPATAAALALGPELVTVVYGQDFADVQTPLVILLTLTPFVPVVNLAASLLGAVGILRPMVIAGLFASIVNIGLDLLLIPDHAAVGAAIANIGAQLAVGIPTIVVAWRYVGPVDWGPSATTRLVFASAIGGGAAFACVAALGGVAGIVAGAVLGVATFTVLAGLVGVISGPDATWLDDTVGHLAGGRMRRVIRFWELDERD
jgi:O-antigen/teichoic acid export membrane protein